jgi:hypothetical protein
MSANSVEFIDVSATGLINVSKYENEHFFDSQA